MGAFNQRVTVSELIEHLQGAPPEAQVSIELWLPDKEYAYPLTDIAQSTRMGVILIAEHGSEERSKQKDPVKCSRCGQEW